MKIKFDHDFIKLYGQKTAILRHIEIVPSFMVQPKAIHYDTAYLKEVDSKKIEGVKEMVTDYYKFPDGLLVRLEFFGNDGIPFTTYRLGGERSLKKFHRHLGEEFEIVVEEKYRIN